MMSDYNYWTLVIFQKAMRYPTSSHFRVPRSCIGHPFSLQNSKEVRSCFPLSCLFASTDGTVITLVKLWGSMNKLMIQSYLSRNPDNSLRNYDEFGEIQYNLPSSHTTLNENWYHWYLKYRAFHGVLNIAALGHMDRKVYHNLVRP